MVIVCPHFCPYGASGCGKFKNKAPSAHVCWLCGGNRAQCLGGFGQGNTVLIRWGAPSGALCRQLVGSGSHPSPWMGKGEGIGLGALILG